MVQKVRTKSSVELYDNKCDESRVYDIEADVHVSEGEMDSIDSGVLRKDGAQMAQFNWWGENRLNITYQGVSVAERNEINIAVDAFINEVKESVKQ